MNTLCMLHSLDIEPGQFGSTVRKGAKWLYRIESEEEIELCVCPNETYHPSDSGKNIVGHGRVIDWWYGVFRDIPARLLQWEHEERSRNYKGLHISMQKAYGPDFDEESFVTVFLYVRLIT